MTFTNATKHIAYSSINCRRLKRLLNVYGIVKGKHGELLDVIDDKYTLKSYWNRLGYDILKFQEVLFRWLLLCEHWFDTLWRNN